MKNKVFIGSSVEGLKIAYAIQQNLRHNAETTVWDQGVFELSSTTIESLIEVLDNSDFGIFVFSPDDIIKFRGIENLVVRDNVLFELGLFIGRLGRNRSFIMLPEGTDFKLPTDLLGITPGYYEVGRSDKSDQAATGPASHQIRLCIEKYGARNIDDSEPKTGNDVSTALIDNQDLLWVDLYVEKKYTECIKELEKKIKKEKDHKLKLNLQLWTAHVHWKMNPLLGDKKYLKLIDENTENSLPYTSYIITLLENDIYEQIPFLINKGIKQVPKAKDEFLCLKADYFTRIGNKHDAVKELNASIKERKSVSLYLKLVDLQDDLKNSHEIIHEALRHFPTNEEIISKYAHIAYNLDLFNISLFLNDKLIQLNRQNPDYWATMGNTYLNLNLNNKALASYIKANKLAEGKQSWILGNIGNLYNNLELPLKAIEYLELAIEQDPKSEYAHNRLSGALKKKEEKKIKDILKQGRIEIRNLVFNNEKL